MRALTFTPDLSPGVTLDLSPGVALDAVPRALEELHAAGQLDWSRAVIDSSHVRALKVGPGPSRARSVVAGRAPSTTR